MTKENEKQLLALLTEFFATRNLNKKDFTRRNPIGVLLKKELSKLKRWKNLNRGRHNPPLPDPDVPF